MIASFVSFGMAPAFPKAIQNEIFLNSGPFAITEQDLDVCYPR
jgi:hypothetical protein